MGITKHHARKRILQLSQLCLDLFNKHVKEAEDEYKEDLAKGLDVEQRQVGIPDTADSVYWVWHRYIEFYSKFL